MDVTQKSTGTLFDEMHTCDLKLEHWPDDEEIKTRRHALGNAVTSRILEFFVHLDPASVMHINSVLWATSAELKRVLKECWVAQEAIMQAQKRLQREGAYNTAEVSMAAFKAQQTNAQRNKLIREIDIILGESSITQLRKTYA